MLACVIIYNTTILFNDCNPVYQLTVVYDYLPPLSIGHPLCYPRHPVCYPVLSS